MLTSEKRGDTRLRKWKVNANLTGCTLNKMLVKRNGEATHQLTAEIEDAAAGIVTHQFTGDLPPGRYKMELEFTDAAGEIFTVPTVGYFELNIEQDLG